MRRLLDRGDDDDDAYNSSAAGLAAPPAVEVDVVPEPDVAPRPAGVGPSPFGAAGSTTQMTLASLRASGSAGGAGGATRWPRAVLLAALVESKGAVRAAAAKLRPPLRPAPRPARLTRPAGAKACPPRRPALTNSSNEDRATGEGRPESGMTDAVPSDDTATDSFGAKAVAAAAAVADNSALVPWAPAVSVTSTMVDKAAAAAAAEKATRYGAELAFIAEVVGLEELLAEVEVQMSKSSFVPGSSA